MTEVLPTEAAIRDSSLLSRFQIRAALPADEDVLLELARHLNTVNLPHDRAHVREVLAHSHASYAGLIPEPSERKFLFLLWDREQRVAVGTSAVVAQLGRHEAPYIYFNVADEEKYSRTLKKHFHHQTLHLGFSYRGPSELAGLVVDPSYRRHALRLGLLISYVRFAFIKARRSWFRDKLLAELLPPLEADGTSHLWEALGRHFTGLSYAEADLLSSRNKEFIRDLFPTSPIYACVLSPEAQAIIGQVGAPTRVVEQMLLRIGFKYAHRVDPFDGGPHFIAKTDQVVPIAQTLALPAAELALDSVGPAESLLVLNLHNAEPFVLACQSDGRIGRDGSGQALSVQLSRETLSSLQAKGGDIVYCLPLPDGNSQSHRPARRSGSESLKF